MPPAKKFLNKAEDAVEEMVQGAVAYERSLTRIADLHVLARADYAAKQASQVAIISGGGSGHEPAHAGFVGEGMLTAAVLGGVFASPSASAVLSAILAVAGKPGCLLIVKNYTGDRLNFGIALEKAKAAGIPCEMVIVSDDCALEEKGVTGRRGIAGTIFVHKAAGAAATAGKSLAEVAGAARAAAAAVGSMGIAMTPCNLPGAAPSDRLSGNQIEVGMGIHGEPGAHTQECVPCDDMVGTMIGAILDKPGYLKVDKGTEVGVLINNLGATSTMEMQVIARAAIANLEKRGLKPTRMLVGPYCTSLDMLGVSISLIALDASLTGALDAATSAPAWGKLHNISSAPNKAGPMPSMPAESIVKGDGTKDDRIAALITAGTKALAAKEPELTEWDKIAGDGDCGYTMKRGAEKVLADLASYSTGDGFALLHALADSVSASMGGTSGALLEIALRAAAGAFKGGKGWAGALTAGVDAMMFYGNGQPGMRTMLDALLPMKEAAIAGGDVKACAAAASKGAESTKEMLALAGRANYVNQDAYKGVPDP
eukprot:CAMPEP_0173445356 /NCGR_PEP_ID=MMETSP1357-20121228/34182_1 /TAXON_ID=77926 /ORGANISM="Hemiselmis rufescens, Strain PCC563" /LENGTH=541 /DNA_ID=CAMNT_0014411525 /DNA_START=28 /DNA_END=1649 /DNA_ORIENTATION=-